MTIKFIFIYVWKLILQSNVYVHGILGGREIAIENAPYQVGYGDICGGVLLHQIWAMTSAHCGTEHNFIRIGCNRRLSGRKVVIISHIIHPKFGKKHRFDYDVQLLKARKKIHFYQRVSAIAITDEDVFDSVTVSGWGYSKEKGDYNEILQQVNLVVISMEECQKVDNYWYNYTLTERMFCAGGLGRDACQGDSGGAAVYRQRVAGISSFGFGCGRNIPGVYTDLTESSIRDWIRQYTGA